jgi:hypothetical protein
VIKKRWWVVVYTGRDPLTGKKRQKTGAAKSRAEARQLEARLIREAGTGRHRAAGNKTVAELLDVWSECRAVDRHCHGPGPGVGAVPGPGRGAGRPPGRAGQAGARDRLGGAAREGFLLLLGLIGFFLLAGALGHFQIIG